MAVAGNSIPTYLIWLNGAGQICGRSGGHSIREYCVPIEEAVVKVRAGFVVRVAGNDSLVVQDRLRQPIEDCHQ